MKKIGILTFWGVPNYGAFAQAYALNKLLKNNYNDYDVKHLAYLHPLHQELYFKKERPVFSSIRKFLSIRYYLEIVKYLIAPVRRYPAFDADWNSIPHIAIDDENELESCYQDVIVTGSDAIWEYSVPAFGDDVHLIGNRLNCKRLVSYAASFGDMNTDDVFAPFIKEGLHRYDDISVRDDNSKIIVDKLLSKDNAKVVLDPTLVYDFKSDFEIPKSKYKDYILVYGNDFPSELISSVIEYAKCNNLTIIGAGIAPNWCDVRLTNIGPKTWIGMFKDAEFVVTCTFHGLMFSINFEKKIVFNQVKYVKNRSTTLLQKLGIYDLYRSGTDLNSVLDYQWDYKIINKRLNIMRSESMEFIRGIHGNE